MRKYVEKLRRVMPSLDSPDRSAWLHDNLRRTLLVPQTYRRSALILVALIFCVISSSAWAQCTTLPFTLLPNTTADGGQVMADLNALNFGCAPGASSGLDIIATPTISGPPSFADGTIAWVQTTLSGTATSPLALPQGFVWPKMFFDCPADSVTAAAIGGNPVDVPCVSISQDLGASSLGSRSTLSVNSRIPVNTGSPPGNNYVAGLLDTMVVTANQGGTGLATQGEFFGMGIQMAAASGATFLNSFFGLEIDMALQAGSSAASKIGLLILNNNGDAVHGLFVDAAVQIDKTAGPGFNTGIQVGGNSMPISTTGTVLKTFGAGTIFSGIDFSTVTFTDPGSFLIAGNGRMIFNGVLDTSTNTENVVINQGGLGSMLQINGPQSSPIANQVAIISRPTGVMPQITATGSDGTVDLVLSGKSGGTAGAVAIAGKFNLANVAGAGGSVATVCVDGSGNVLTRAGAC